MKPQSLAALLLLTSCAHPEDRRWARVTWPTDPAIEAAVRPSVNVYSFATPAEEKAPVTVRDLAGEGQAAYIDQIASAKDPQVLAKRVAKPLSGANGGLDPTQAPSLDRTVVISVSKAPRSTIGDRLMRTVVTIVPHSPDFEFSGYTIAATDNEIQNIAHLETSTEASLEASVAPPIALLGSTSLAGKLSRTHTSAADISTQFEKLNIDISPKRIVVTRESERGTDVMGNTIIKLTLVPAPPQGMPAAFTFYLVANLELFKDGKPLDAKDATLDVEEAGLLRKCEITADVSASYQLRHVTKGQEYYTEGKQVVQIIDGEVGPHQMVLVRAADTQPPLWQIKADNGGALIAKGPDHIGHLVLFNNFSAAESFVAWFNKSPASKIGTDGLTLIWARGAIASPAPFNFNCTGDEVTR